MLIKYALKKPLQIFNSFFRKSTADTWTLQSRRRILRSNSELQNTGTLKRKRLRVIFFELKVSLKSETFRIRA
jgi:hypothetical protein